MLSHVTVGVTNKLLQSPLDVASKTVVTQILNVKFDVFIRLDFTKLYLMGIMNLT